MAPALSSVVAAAAAAAAPVPTPSPTTVTPALPIFVTPVTSPDSASGSNGTLFAPTSVPDPSPQPQPSQQADPLVIPFGTPALITLSVVCVAIAVSIVIGYIAAYFRRKNLVQNAYPDLAQAPHPLSGASFGDGGDANGSRRTLAQLQQTPHTDHIQPRGYLSRLLARHNRRHARAVAAAAAAAAATSSSSASLAPESAAPSPTPMQQVARRDSDPGAATSCSCLSRLDPSDPRVPRSSLINLRTHDELRALGWSQASQKGYVVWSAKRARYSERHTQGRDLEPLPRYELQDQIRSAGSDLGDAAVDDAIELAPTSAAARNPNDHDTSDHQHHHHHDHRHG
ncbi:hypothetical protein RI367_007625 [Sorochytrium milnesiophthora]